jgi:hypothetical protein
MRGAAVARAMTIATLCAMVATGATARPSLRDVPVIDDGLFTLGLADQIRKTCPEISARLFPAYSFAKGLEKQARALGYTEAEVKAHLKSDAEKNRLRARAKAYFKAQGLPQDPSGYCALGRSEIKRDTAVGRLLRMAN